MMCFRISLFCDAKYKMKTHKIHIFSNIIFYFICDHKVCGKRFHTFCLQWNESLCISCCETHNYMKILGWTSDTVIKTHENNEFSQIKTFLTAHLDSLTSLIIIFFNMCQNGLKSDKNFILMSKLFYGLKTPTV